MATNKPQAAPKISEVAALAHGLGISASTMYAAFPAIASGIISFEYQEASRTTGISVSKLREDAGRGLLKVTHRDGKPVILTLDLASYVIGSSEAAA